ncbi:MAG: hypothetical protein N2484_17740 [Clostridia bacterium]|nr:hypothetical protein [Clostridia bacterium]
MKAVANSILATLIISIFLLTFTNFILFFPWYLTLVFETFNLSTQAASVNYIKPEMVKFVEDDLKSRPLFKDPLVKDQIFVHMDGNKITPSADESTVKSIYCKQRGKSFKVSITASFPFVIKAFGNDFTRTKDITFELPTTGVKYYKDLP